MNNWLDICIKKQLDRCTLNGNVSAYVLWHTYKKHPQNLSKNEFIQAVEDGKERF